MSQAYIADAVRTPVGKRGGALSAVHPAGLAAEAIAATLGRNDVDPARVDDVVFGCVDAIGPQAGNIAFTGWLAAGFPQDVAGVTVDRQCGSSQQAIHFAAQAVMSGTAELVVAGGVANMSRIPISRRRWPSVRSSASPPHSRTRAAGGVDTGHRRYRNSVEQNSSRPNGTSAGQRWSGGRCAVISARLLQSKVDGSSGRSLRLATSRSTNVPARRAWRRWLRSPP